LATLRNRQPITLTQSTPQLTKHRPWLLQNIRWFKSHWLPN